MINPYEIKTFPVVVLVDNRKSFLGWAIKNHSDGCYNHAMILFMPDLCASQDSTYKAVNITKYMKPHITLKFWAYTGNKKDELIDSIKKDLKSPKTKRRYDYLGILGQFLKLRWLNNPKTYYCSERVSKYLIDIGMKFPLHPSPSKLNQLFKKNKKMKSLGYWVDN